MRARNEKVNYVLFVSLWFDIYDSFARFKHYKSVRFKLNFFPVDDYLSCCVLIYNVHKSNPSTCIILIESTIYMF